MDDIVDQSVLGNVLQRISELERIAQHQLNTDPPRAEAANQTNATNAVEELYQRFPSLRRQSSSQESVASTSTSRRSLSSTRTSSSTTFTTPPTSAMTRPTSRSRSTDAQGSGIRTKSLSTGFVFVLLPFVFTLVDLFCLEFGFLDVRLLRVERVIALVGGVVNVVLLDVLLVDERDRRDVLVDATNS